MQTTLIWPNWHRPQYHTNNPKTSFPPTLSKLISRINPNHNNTKINKNSNNRHPQSQQQSNKTPNFNSTNCNVSILKRTDTVSLTITGTFMKVSSKIRWKMVKGSIIIRPGKSIPGALWMMRLMAMAGIISCPGLSIRAIGAVVWNMVWESWSLPMGTCIRVISSMIYFTAKVLTNTVKAMSSLAIGEAALNMEKEHSNLSMVICKSELGLTINFKYDFFTLSFYLFSYNLIIWKLTIYFSQ